MAVGLAAVVVAGAGCSDDDGDDGRAAAATVPSGSASSASDGTTPTTVGVDEVPDEITVEYVQRVMDALDASWGDMYRLYVESGGPTAETAAWLDALYDEPELSRIDVDLGREAADGFDSTRMPPGDPTTRVLELISASPDCIYFEADRRFADVLTTEAVDTSTFVALGTQAARKHNPTAWTIELSGRAEPGVTPPDPCA